MMSEPNPPPVTRIEQCGVNLFALAPSILWVSSTLKVLRPAGQEKCSESARPAKKPLVQYFLAALDLLNATFSFRHEHIQASGTFQGRTSRGIEVAAAVRSRILGVPFGNV